ncbi:MAG: response regulator [Acidobacteria bacterium]|nr:response regulator [Acidobacteriota bacterium]
MTNILLVDDDVDFVASNKMALEKEGFNVLTAHNGKDAMKIVESTDIDAAVLDVLMDTPDEGMVLARKLRKNPRTEKIPLILLTSLNEVNREAGYKVRFSDMDRDEVWLPIDRYLDKPVKSKDLSAEIRRLLSEPAQDGTYAPK